jgi:hypothetical protein
MKQNTAVNDSLKIATAALENTITEMRKILKGRKQISMRTFAIACQNESMGIEGELFRIAAESAFFYEGFITASRLQEARG